MINKKYIKQNKTKYLLNSNSSPSHSLAPSITLSISLNESFKVQINQSITYKYRKKPKKTRLYDIHIHPSKP